MDIRLDKLRYALPLLAATHALAVALPARADGWLVSPTTQPTPESVMLMLGKSGLSDSLAEVLVGLNASQAFKNDYRLIDLETGEARAVAPGELSSIKWVEGGQIVTATLAASRVDQLVLVRSDYQGMGAALVVMQGMLVTHATVLDADQRLLLGEPPCDIGFVPESGMSATQCVDIDECAAMLHDCAENATCENTEGSFECECEDGFEGDGKVCLAMDTDAGAMGGDAGADMGHDMDVSQASDGCSCTVVGAQPDPARSEAGWLAVVLGLGAAFMRLGRRRTNGR